MDSDQASPAEQTSKDGSPSQSRGETDGEALEDDGMGLQIAIDGLAVGDTEPLKKYLARKEGLNPDECTIRTTPWTAPDPDEEGKGGHQLTYIGKLDDILQPDDKRGLEERGPPPRVEFAPASKPFQYDVLDGSHRLFRLIRLAPPDSEGITRELELRTFSLADAPSYICLSYVWGDPARFLPITCNGTEIKATQNLFHALQNCFKRFKDVWLWADGICINQDDIEERAQQVMLAGAIYRQASMVLAHPGHFRYALSQSTGGEFPEESENDSPSDKDTEHVASTSDAEDVRTKVERETLNTADEDASPVVGPHDGGNTRNGENAQESISIMNYLCRIWSSTSDYEVKSDTEWAKYQLPDLESEEGRTAWSRLLEFWAQDLFSRTWVLQELVLAAKVVVLFGETAISLDAVMEFWTEAMKHGLPKVLRIGVLADECARIMHLSPLSRLKTFRERRLEHVKEGEVETEGSAEDQPKTGLLELLALNRTNLVTDDRDKVYALLGLADDDAPGAITPDYSLANTASRLYIDVARRFVEAGLGSELLHYAGVDTRTPGLPSWVPDWTFQSRSAMKTELYRCMGSTTPRIEFPDRDNQLPKLNVRGAVLSSIKIVGPAWRYYSHDTSQPSFARFSNAPDTDIPSFNDEDARNFILTMALTIEAGSAVKRYATEGWENAVARTLAMDCSWDRQRIGAPPPAPDPVNADTKETKDRNASSEFRDAFEAFRAFYNKGPNSKDDLTRPGVRVHQTSIFMWLLEFDKQRENELQKRMVPFTVSMQEAQRGRRYAVLSGFGGRKMKGGDRGFIATVPYNAEKEDLVVMLEGFSTPFVLRKCEGDEEDEYRLVGDCYVHGVMDGELLRDAGEVQDGLEDSQIVTDKAGKRHALWTPKGYAEFRDFTLR